MYPVNLCLLMETFYIRRIAGIFEFIDVVKDMFPNINREFFQCLYYPFLDLNFHSDTSEILPLIRPVVSEE
jgi:hypothetical protein